MHHALLTRSARAGAALRGWSSSSKLCTPSDGGEAWPHIARLCCAWPRPRVAEWFTQYVRHRVLKPCVAVLNAAEDEGEDEGDDDGKLLELFATIAERLWAVIPGICKVAPSVQR